MRSAPPAVSTVSVPKPATTVLAPAPPSIVSLPPFPKMKSLPLELQSVAAVGRILTADDGDAAGADAVDRIGPLVAEPCADAGERNEAVVADTATRRVVASRVDDDVGPIHWRR